MSKIIKITPEYQEACRKDFEEALAKAKVSDGQFSFSKTFSLGKKTATVYFTANAWTKMVMLLQEFDKEIAWHGCGGRVEGEENAYYIDDIFVYPQSVTGASVDMDPEAYTKWLIENGDDDKFFRICMQAHSHVNMGTTPSAVDLNHQEEILSQLPEDSFYIFMIYNKSFKNNIKIYDLAKNVLFEDGEVSVKLWDDNISFDDFIADAKSKVVTKTYTTPTYLGPQKPVSPGPYKPMEDKGKTQETPKAETKTPPTEKKTTRVAAAGSYGGYGKYGSNYYNSLYGYDYDYDYDDPNGAFYDGRRFR